MEEAVPRPRSADEMARRRLRLAGAFGVSGVTMVVAAVAHGIASGAWPTLLAIAIALPFSVLMGLPLLGRRVKSGRIALVVLLDQTFFHVIASATSSLGAGSSAASGLVGHSHGSPAATQFASVSGFAGVVIPDAAMIAGHLGTAAMSFALLRGGWELILRVIAHGAALLVRRIATLIAIPISASRPSPAPSVVRPLRSVVLRHAVSRRGPPMPALLG